MQTCKPGSVSFGERIPSGSRHFSGTTITHRLKQPTHPDLPKQVQRAAAGSGLIWFFNAWGLPRTTVASRRVRSYRTFSPLPGRQASGRYCFLRHFPSSEDSSAEAFPLGSRLPCVARTFLCSLLNSDGIVCGAKIRKESCAGKIENKPRGHGDTELYFSVPPCLRG